MNILLASSELHPYSKSGGLADMVGALAKAMARAGHEVAVVTPLYRGIQERFPDIAPFAWDLQIPLGKQIVAGGVRVLRPMERLTIYFIDQPGFYQRGSLYQENGADFPDNAERFIFLSKAVVNLARYLPLRPEIVHLHDWQVGLVPALILDQKQGAGWVDAPKSCLTIHNLAYQGIFPSSAFDLTGLPPEYFQPEGVEYFGGINCLKAGLVYSDALTTVSPRYAREITTEAFGCNLDGILRRRQSMLTGILNGVDYDEWTTEENSSLRHSFSVADLDGKRATKRELQAEMGLPQDDGIPLFGNISRLADQKGVDIQITALEEMLSSRMQFVLLGSGSPEFERAYRKLATRYPDKVSVRIGFDQGLSHRIEAGVDFFLMPSRFEPCGLNQMYSLRYGAIPIVRATGGLDDSVVDASEDQEHADGIKFREYSGRALAKAIRKALVLYEHPEVIAHYRRNGMLKDFSWERTTDAYTAVYERIRGNHSI